MERAPVTPTPNRFVSLLIDEFDGDWGEQDIRTAHRFVSPPRDKPNSQDDAEDDAATLRQSSPVEPTLPHSQEPENAQGDLGNALRQVAAALASDNPGADASDDPFAALRQFCSSPPSSKGRPDGSSARSSLGANEDWDQEAAQFLSLLLQQQKNRSGKDDCIDPLLIAVEKMENRRLSLDPNWKPLAGRAVAPTVEKESAEWRRASEGGFSQVQQPPATDRSTQNVDLPLLPPSLAGASNTPLRDKDAFTRSTPPLPVRGAADRQAYLQNRVSTQKLAERITRATRLEAARQTLEPASADEEMSAERDLRSPAFGQAASCNSPDQSLVDEALPASPMIVLTNSNSPEQPAADLQERAEGSPQIREDRRMRPSDGLMEVAVPNLGSPAVQSGPQPEPAVRRLSMGRAAVKSKAKRSVPPARSMRSAVDSVDSSPFTEVLGGSTATEDLQENRQPIAKRNNADVSKHSEETHAETRQTGSRESAEPSAAPSKDDRVSKKKGHARVITEPIRIEMPAHSSNTRASPKSRVEVQPLIQPASPNPDPVDCSTEVLPDELSAAPVVVVTDDKNDKPSNRLYPPSEGIEAADDAVLPCDAEPPGRDGAESLMSPSWTTPRPAGAAGCTDLAVVEEQPETSMIVTESARRRSMGIQVSAKAKPKARRAKARAIRELLMPVESKEGHLRRISICEAEDETAQVPGKIVRQRSKRIRIAPLAWWAGEHIEYSAVEGDPCKAKATAVYKVEAIAPSKRKKSSEPLAIDNRPASARSNASTSARQVDSHARKRSRSSAVRKGQPESSSQRTIARELFQDGSLGEEWMLELSEPLGRTLRTSAFIGDEEEVVAIRSKEETWVPVSQNGYSYSVRLLLQTIRNTSVEFKLEPGRSKGQDQTRATQILLSMHSGEDERLVVETWAEGREEHRETNKLAVGDWLFIPPKSFYDVANTSRTRSCVILAHVVACDNELFRSFVNNEDS